MTVTDRLPRRFVVAYAALCVGAGAVVVASLVAVTNAPRRPAVALTTVEVRQAFAQAGIDLVASAQTPSGTVFLRPRRRNASSIGLLVVVAGQRSQVAAVLQEAPLPGSTRAVQFLELRAGNVWVRGAVWRATGSNAPVLRAVATLRRLQQPTR